MTRQNLPLVRFIGRAYVIQQPEQADYCVCIDSEQTKGIALMYFAKEDIANAYAATDALNLWAGFEVADDVVATGPQLLRN